MARFTLQAPLHADGMLALPVEARGQTLPYLKAPESSQAKAMYRDDQEAIAGNCDSQLFLGGNENSATEYISERLGNQTTESIETIDLKAKAPTAAAALPSAETSGSFSTATNSEDSPTNTCRYLLRGIRPFIPKNL